MEDWREVKGEEKREERREKRKDGSKFERKKNSTMFLA